MAVEVVHSPDGETVAIKTAPSVTAGEYFYFNTSNGGYYDSADKANEWKAAQNG